MQRCTLLGTATVHAKRPTVEELFHISRVFLVTCFVERVVLRHVGKRQQLFEAQAVAEKYPLLCGREYFEEEKVCNRFASTKTTNTRAW